MIMWSFPVLIDILMRLKAVALTELDQRMQGGSSCYADSDWADNKYTLGGPQVPCEKDL